MSARAAARRFALAVPLACLIAASSLDVFAAERARLSADLVAHMAAGSVAIDVIVHGNKVQVTSSLPATTCAYENISRRVPCSA